MLITTIPAQLAHALASARLSLESTLDAIGSAIAALMNGNPMGDKRPAMAVVPANRRRESICAHHNSGIAGTQAYGAVRMYADPVTEGWRVLDFGKTTTGDPGHSQPSRSAP